MNRATPDVPVWDFKTIAADFVKNLGSMPADIQIKELSALVRVIKLQAEVEQLQALAPQRSEEIAAARARLLMARLNVSFHNHILINKE